MLIPAYVLNCLNTLENAGFPCYAVGGCVRDALFGLTPHDYDLCTAATPAQMKEIFHNHALVLAGEKHVSGLYDTCVFEFRDGQARNALNHIQKEEQEHGKQLYDYMTVNGMYQ